MKSRAIVLRTTRYTDEQMIVRLLTESCGCVDMMVRISRSRRAAVRASLFQPLSVLDVEWNVHPRASLQRPVAVQTALPLSSIPYDANKLAIAMFVAEFLTYSVGSEPEASDIFRFTLRSVEWLDACERGFANFHLVFLLRMLYFLGFMPEAETFRSGSFFDLRSSSFTSIRPLHADFLSGEDAALIPKLMRMHYATMHVFRFSGAERSRLLEKIILYYRLHLPGFPELKSLAVLRELFSH